MSLRLLVCLLAGLLYLPTTFALSRTITIENQCPMDILWGSPGTPIQTNGKPVTCSKADQGKECAGWNGSKPGEKGICDNEVCYFAPPVLSSASDDKPPFYLKHGQTREYQVDLIHRMVQSTSVEQYSLNIGPQFDCVLSNGLYQCQSATCTRSSTHFDGRCIPSKGLQAPFTQVEMTLNNEQNDFYDLSIINGMNLPAMIEATAKPAEQNFQSNFWCTSPGKAPSGDAKKLKGCTWKVIPPANFPASVFVQIALSGGSFDSCATDTDCKKNGEKCGLRFPADLKTWTNKAKPSFCGKPLGYYTVTDICSLGGLSSELDTMFACSDLVVINPPEGSSTSPLTLSNTAYYQCNTQGNWTLNVESGLFLDSCYNYQNKDFSTSNFCCGCIDWEGIPTDENVQCAKAPSTKDTTSTVYPNGHWLSLVKPKLQWLIETCPDAYEYQYGDKHGTIQCSSVNPATTPGNNMAYKITFCPGGNTLFSSASTVRVTPPAKESMQLTNLLGPGLYCDPVSYRFPVLENCGTAGFRCLFARNGNQFIGTWQLQQAPSCHPQMHYVFSHLQGLTAFYQNGGVSYQFIPARGWTCEAVGNALNCHAIAQN